MRDETFGEGLARLAVHHASFAEDYKDIAFMAGGTQAAVPEEERAYVLFDVMEYAIGDGHELRVDVTGMSQLAYSVSWIHRNGDDREYPVEVVIK